MWGGWGLRLKVRQGRGRGLWGGVLCYRKREVSCLICAGDGILQTRDLLIQEGKWDTDLVYGGRIVDVVESAYVDEVAEFSLRRRIPASCSLVRDVEVAVEVAIACLEVFSSQLAKASRLLVYLEKVV